MRGTQALFGVTACGVRFDSSACGLEEASKN